MSRNRTLSEEVAERIRAGMSGLYIRSFEHEDAIEEIRRLCVRPSNQWVMATFDVDEGMHILDNVGGEWVFTPGWMEPQIVPNERTKAVQVNWARKNEVMVKIDRAIKSLPGLNAGKLIKRDDEDDEGYQPPAILILKNAHLLLKQSPVLAQMVANQVWSGKQHAQHLVLLSPILDLPKELEKLFESGFIEHRLPDREQLKEILEGTVGEDEVPEENRLERVIDAACGLTRLGAEDAFSLSVVRRHAEEPKLRVDPATVFEVKAQSLKMGGGALTLYEGKENFSDLGGAAFLKQFAMEIASKRHANPLFRPRGIFLVGVPGIGKDYFSRCLANEIGLPLLIADLGSTKSKYQGESQQGMREMTFRADAMAPCIMTIKEFEKSATGTKSSGHTDSGTTAQSNAWLLNWMSDHTSEVFLIVTCNDIRQLMLDNPEFARMGRFDGMFFLDFPGRIAKDAIWEIHLRRFEFLEPGQSLKSSGIALPADELWTGAEIEGACRIARLRGKTVAEVGKNMPKIADQAKDAIEATRNWANGICYAAEYDGIYRIETHEQLLLKATSGNGVRRKVLKRTRPMGPEELN